MKNLTNRHLQVLEALKVLKEATAREVAQYMVSQGYAVNLERNLSHPRLTELESMGKVAIKGYKIDPTTRKEVSIYRLVVA